MTYGGFATKGLIVWENNPTFRDRTTVFVDILVCLMFSYKIYLRTICRNSSVSPKRDYFHYPIPVYARTDPGKARLFFSYTPDLHKHNTKTKSLLNKYPTEPYLIYGDQIGTKKLSHNHIIPASIRYLW